MEVMAERVALGALDWSFMATLLASVGFLVLGVSSFVSSRDVRAEQRQRWSALKGHLWGRGYRIAAARGRTTITQGPDHPWRVSTTMTRRPLRRAVRVESRVDTGWESLPEAVALTLADSAATGWQWAAGSWVLAFDTVDPDRVSAAHAQAELLHQRTALAAHLDASLVRAIVWPEVFRAMSREAMEEARTTIRTQIAPLDPEVALRLAVRLQDASLLASLGAIPALEERSYQLLLELAPQSAEARIAVDERIARKFTLHVRELARLLSHLETHAPHRLSALAVQLLLHHETAARELAVRTLGRTADRSVIPTLRNHAAHASPRMRSAIGSAIRAIEDRLARAESRGGLALAQEAAPGALTIAANEGPAEVAAEAEAEVEAPR